MSALPHELVVVRAKVSDASGGGAALTVSAKPWLALGRTPLAAVMVIG
jgi:hypothetical protein